jgi:hypothetical protein
MPSRRPAGAPPGSPPRGAVPTLCPSPIRRAAVPGCGGFHDGECGREPNAQWDRAAADRSPCAHHVAAPGAPGMSPPSGLPGVPDHPGAHEATADWRGHGSSRQALAGPAVPACYLRAGHLGAGGGDGQQRKGAHGQHGVPAEEVPQPDLVLVEAVATQAQSQSRWRPSGRVRRGTRASGGSRPAIAGLANHQQAGARAIAIGAAK